MSARTIPLTAGALSAAGALFAGYTVRETAGAAATVRIYDNASAGSGTLVATIALAANGSDNRPGFNVYAANGLFAVITGTVEGSLFVA